MATIFLESCWDGVASGSVGVINDACIINTGAGGEGGGTYCNHSPQPLVTIIAGVSLLSDK